MICALIGSIAGQQGRRVGIRVRPAIQEEAAQDEAEFYDGQQEEQQVLIRQPPLGRAIASQPRIQNNIAARQKTSNEERPAPVQTIRNYNKLNDDGSFTFGYESADGSFKEETRGTDCVVRGKYGYIDPDGNKREFTYVSGNPCDPNVDKQEQEEEPEAPAQGSAEENIPANYPLNARPLKAARRPSAPPSRPSTTLFQQQFATQEAAAADEEEEEQPQVNIRPRPTIRPTQFTTVQQEPQVFRQSSPAQRPTFAPQPSRATVRFEPATTFRPQIQLTTSSPLPARSQTPPGSKPGLDFSAEFKKFQIDLDEINPSRGPKPAQAPASQSGSSALYQTELVFDPATGQYNTVVYQQVPKAIESPAAQRFGPPPPQPQPQFFSPPRQAFSQPPPSAFQQQQLFQQQQSALQVQQSQQLFEQQQEQKRATEAPPRIPHSLLRQSPQTFSSQASPAPQRFQPEPQPQRFLPSDASSQRFSSSSARSQRFPSEAPQPQRFSQPAPQQEPQPFFFVAAPSERQQFASGQIDNFLRGHNLQF